jgi:hypothetical protein
MSEAPGMCNFCGAAPQDQRTHMPRLAKAPYFQALYDHIHASACVASRSSSG